MLLNVVHRHVRKNMNQTNDSTEQRCFWTTHVNRNNLQSRFPSSLFVWEAKRKVSSPFPSSDLRPFCEERTPHRRLQPQVSPFPFKYALTLRNRPLPSSEDPHFQNEARCTTSLVKMSFICMRNEKWFPYQRLSTYPRFEMAYLYRQVSFPLSRPLAWIFWPNHCTRIQNNFFRLTCFTQNRLWLGSVL